MRIIVKKHLLLFTLILFMGLTKVGWGQILTFEFSALTGSEVSAASNSNDANLTSSTITRGAGLTAGANGGRFNATSWALTSIANAVSGNDYMEFTITPNSGYQFSVSSIVVQWQRSSTGNTAISLRSSVDSYASDLDAVKLVTDNTTTQTFTWTFTQSNSSTPVTYRFYSYAEATAGTGGPGDGTGNDIVVNGSVSSFSSPNIIISTSSLTNFGNVILGSSSAEQSYTVEGSNLTNDIVVTPPTDFEISLTSGSGFATTPITLTQTGGTVITTTIYARFTPITTGVKSVNITNVSTDATTRNVAVSGTGTNSNTSDIIEQTSFTYPTNIDYTTYQNANIIGDAGDIEVAQFTIRDGGGAADGDVLGTTLTAITFTLTNYSNVRSIALYDGVTEVGTETVGATSVSFSGLTLTASDAGTKDFSVRVSFNTAVTDNQQIQLTVTSAGYDDAGSAFATASAGGAVSSIAGDNNRIEVTATKLSFTSVPTSMNVNSTFSITVKAQDANNNTDLDNIASVTLAKNTGTGILSSATGLIQSLASGAYSWSDLQYTVAESFDLSVSASGLTSATSSSITGVNGPNQGDIFITHLSPGFNTATDEFIVLFNNSSSAIDLNGYEVRYFSAAGNAGAALISFSTSTSIPSKKYILLSSVATVSVGSANSARDYTMSSGMATSGQVALRNASQTSNIIYAVAWGTITVYTASMAEAATYSGTGMISLSTSGDTYTRTSYNSNNTQYSFTAAASIVDIPTSGTTALPVELTSFSATAQNKAVNLSWKTATEVNNYGFEVERIRNEELGIRNWSKVGFVNGAGNSNSPKEYSFTDKSAASGKYLYRLKQLDNDGQYSYSKEVEVDLGTPTAFALEQNYPNPFNPTTSMQYSVSSLPNGTVGKQFVTIKVFDMLGREVALLVNGEKEPGTYTAEFATTGLASGTYIYRMQAGEFVQTKKMVILK